MVWAFIATSIHGISLRARLKIGAVCAHVMVPFFFRARSARRRRPKAEGRRRRALRARRKKGTITWAQGGRLAQSTVAHKLDTAHCVASRQCSRSSPNQVLTHAARAAASQAPLVAARGAREGLWLEQLTQREPQG